MEQKATIAGGSVGLTDGDKLLTNPGVILRHIIAANFIHAHIVAPVLAEGCSRLIFGKLNPKLLQLLGVLLLCAGLKYLPLRPAGDEA